MTSSPVTAPRSNLVAAAVRDVFGNLVFPLQMYGNYN